MLKTGGGTQEMKDDLVCVCVCVKRERGSCRPTGCWTESLDFSFAKKQKQPDLMRQLCASSLHYSHKNKRVFSVYLVSNSRNKLLHRAANRAVFICLNRQCIEWEHTHTLVGLTLQFMRVPHEIEVVRRWSQTKLRLHRLRPFFGNPGEKWPFK